MEIGIGLPTTIPGVQRGELIDWAKRADAAGFSTLGTSTGSSTRTTSRSSHWPPRPR
jgi:hypothetical protein